MKSPSKKPKATVTARIVPAKAKSKLRRPVVREELEEEEVDQDEIEEVEEEEEEEEPEEEEADDEEDEEADEDDEPKYKRKEVKGEAKGFFDTISDTLKSAGETAKKYTTIGVSHAEIEKLRYDLKTAYAGLGEVAMRCWDDACDLGLSSKDPAVAQAVKRVREVRRKIREKEAKIAQLKKDDE